MYVRMSIQYAVLEFEPTTFGTKSPPITNRPGLPPIQGSVLGLKSDFPLASNFDLMEVPFPSKCWSVLSRSMILIGYRGLVSRDTKFTLRQYSKKSSTIIHVHNCELAESVNSYFRYFRSSEANMFWAYKESSISTHLAKYIEINDFVTEIWDPGVDVIKIFRSIPNYAVLNKSPFIGYCKSWLTN